MKFHQAILTIQEVWAIFANCLGTDTKGDYIAHSKSRPSLSVEFLWVGQYIQKPCYFQKKMFKPVLSIPMNDNILYRSEFHGYVYKL